MSEPQRLLPKKLLVVALPRTGTTSLCRELLDLNYRVAHTAYTQASWHAATAVADTPAYADYRELTRLWQPSAWLYLTRPWQAWLPSMRFLINQLHQQPPNHLPPIFWRSWARVFGPFDPNISDQQLKDSFWRHEEDVQKAALALGLPLYNLTLTETSDCAIPLNQVLLSNPRSERALAIEAPYRLNTGRVTAWASLKHPNKISSHLSGDLGRQYFDYEPGR